MPPASARFVTARSSSTMQPAGVLPRTEIAFDGANWLVVWAEDGGTGAEIHGALVSSGSGSPTTPQPPVGTIVNGSDFKIASTTGTVEEDPLVAFNGIDYVVAWHS